MQASDVAKVFREMDVLQKWQECFADDSKPDFEAGPLGLECLNERRRRWLLRCERFFVAGCIEECVDCIAKQKISQLPDETRSYKGKLVHQQTVNAFKNWAAFCRMMRVAKNWGASRDPLIDRIEAERQVEAVRQEWLGKLKLIEYPNQAFLKLLPLLSEIKEYANKALSELSFAQKIEYSKKPFKRLVRQGIEWVSEETSISEEAAGKFINYCQQYFTHLKHLVKEKKREILYQVRYRMLYAAHSNDPYSGHHIEALVQRLPGMSANNREVVRSVAVAYRLDDALMDIFFPLVARGKNEDLLENFPWFSRRNNPFGIHIRFAFTEKRLLVIPDGEYEILHTTLQPNGYLGPSLAKLMNLNSALKSLVTLWKTEYWKKQTLNLSKRDHIWLFYWLDFITENLRACSLVAIDSELKKAWIKVYSLQCLRAVYSCQSLLAGARKGLTTTDKELLEKICTFAAALQSEQIAPLLMTIQNEISELVVDCKTTRETILQTLQTEINQGNNGCMHLITLAKVLSNEKQQQAYERIMSLLNGQVNYSKPEELPQDCECVAFPNQWHGIESLLAVSLQSIPKPQCDAFLFVKQCDELWKGHWKHGSLIRNWVRAKETVVQNALSKVRQGQEIAQAGLTLYQLQEFYPDQWQAAQIILQRQLSELPKDREGYFALAEVALTEEQLHQFFCHRFFYFLSQKPQVLALEAAVKRIAFRNPHECQTFLLGKILQDVSEGIKQQNEIPFSYPLACEYVLDEKKKNLDCAIDQAIIEFLKSARDVRHLLKIIDQAKLPFPCTQQGAIDLREVIKQRSKDPHCSVGIVLVNQFAEGELKQKLCRHFIREILNHERPLSHLLLVQEKYLFSGTQLWQELFGEEPSNETLKLIDNALLNTKALPENLHQALKRLIAHDEIETNPFQQRIAFWLRLDEHFRQLVTVFRGKDFNQAKELYDQMSVSGDRDNKPLKDAMIQRTDQKLITELQLMIHSLTATQIGELLKLWGEFTVKGAFYEHIQFMDQHHPQVEEVIQEFLKQIQKGSAKEFFEQEFSKVVLMILIRALSPKVKQEVCQQLFTLTCPSPLYLLAVRDLVKMIREGNLSGIDALLKTLAHARLLAKGEPLPPDGLPYSLPLTGQFVSPHAGSILSQTTVGGEGLSNQVQTSIGLRALYPDPILSRVLMEERHAYPILDLPDRMCVHVKINDRPFVFDFSSTCPGIRQMVTTLHQVLFAEETPTALVSFPEGAQGMTHDFPAMVVALPYEHSLAKVWSAKQHFPITMSSFTRHLLTALCAHYTADTPQAYSLVKEEDSYRLLHAGIDGAFAPEKKERSFLSPLMCCPEMNNPLDHTTVQCFLQHRVEEVLLQWMGLVWQQKMQSDRVFMDRDLKIQADQGIYLLPPFSIESLQDLLKRFLHLQYFLKKDLNQTGMQLLQKIHPLIHAQLNSKSDAPYERFSQVAQPTLEQHDSGWYQMKETGTEFVQRCFDRCAHVLHHHQQWDQSFDEARRFCETYVPKITATKTQQQRVINGETVSVTPEEWVRILTGFQDQVLPLNLSSLSATALKCLCEQLKSVPLKKLNFAGTTELTPALLLPLLSPHLEELDLTGCTKLPETIFADIAKNCPKLERLIARNFSIKAFGQRRRPLQFPNLQLLIIDNPNLTEVHLNAPHIQFVTLNAPQLNKLTLLGNQKSLHLMTHSSVQPKLLAKKQLTDYSTTDGTQFTTTKTKSPFTLQWN